MMVWYFWQWFQSHSIHVTGILVEGRTDGCVESCYKKGDVESGCCVVYAQLWVTLCSVEGGCLGGLLVFPRSGCLVQGWR